ncbi:MAG: hemerythrin domain-containing protein [Candidatus Competibacteraceae bacterium]|nr:hemerythrin domain-containing protein [Candidatus Competibacteraceae bacterium]
MHKTSTLIRSEHRRLAAVLNCLIGVLDDVQARHQEPDFQLFQEVLDYLESFLYRFHHPKEDSHLFPALRRRAPDQAEAVLERLEAEHQRGPELIGRLRESLARYRQQGPVGFQGFRDAVEDYRQFEWQHMGTEEREVLPLAERTFSEQDWAGLDEVFNAHDDPIFGDQTRTALGRRLSSIVSHAPAPHGLGEPHPGDDHHS